MGLALNIKSVGFEGARKMLRKVPEAFPRAASEAINRGLISGRKIAAKAIRGRYNISSAVVKEQGMNIKKASWIKVGGTLEAKGTMLPVTLFKPSVRWKRTPKGRRQFVRVAIIRGTRKPLKAAFMAKNRIWERIDQIDPRSRIHPVSTIGVPHMIGQTGVSKQVEETIVDATQRRLKHNVARFMTAAKKK
jgi:hypothetical protein